MTFCLSILNSYAEKAGRVAVRGVSTADSLGLMGLSAFVVHAMLKDCIIHGMNSMARIRFVFQQNNKKRTFLKKEPKHLF